LRKHQSDLKAAFARAKESEVRQELRERIGKLTAGSATLWVGGVTETEINLRKELAGRTAETLRGAMREGVVPGGGAALLACRGALKERLAGSSDLDEHAALRILLRALEEPTRTIIANAGCDVAEAMAMINRAGLGYGFEVHSERAADMAQVGILDATSVTRMAVTSAVMTAALALTTDVLVHHKKPVERTEP
jgi:chaperonin GroEL